MLLAVAGGQSFNMTVPKIISVGKATQDVFLSSSTVFKPYKYKGVYYEQLPLGQKLDIDEVVFTTGGNATNAAVTFARQGIHSIYSWVLGTDLSSETILRELDDEGVDTRAVLQHDLIKTSYSTILLASNGERTILNYHGTTLSSRSRMLNLDRIKESDWLYVSALGDIDLLERVVSKAVEHGVKVMLNPSNRELKSIAKLRSLLSDVSVLSVNKEEAQKIVSGETLEELARHAARYCPVVLVSDGPNGSMITDRQTIIRAGMYEDVPVVDRTGGGDAFASGFLSQWATGKSLKHSVIFASANSTSVVKKIGSKAGILHKGVSLHEMPLDERNF